MRKANNKTKLFLSFSAAALSLMSCKEPILAEKGGIDIITNVYFEASKNLENVQSYHLSRLNFYGGNILELIPDQTFPEVNSMAYFVKDSMAYRLSPEIIPGLTVAQIRSSFKPIAIKDKKEGTLFLEEKIPNYRNRKKLSDTVIFKKKYKRFEINSPWTYTRYYIVPTDTIMPYSIYSHAERDYGGRMERIDSYNKKEDIFVTLQLLPRSKWDDEAADFFNYNKFISKANKKQSK